MTSDAQTTEQAAAALASSQRSDRFPPGVPYIVANEGAERFSYYGMRAILYTYLASLYVGFVPEADLDPETAASAKAHATAVAHLFMAGVYAFPMIGAILADRLLGKFRVILYVSLIYCAGHGVLAIAGRLGALGNLQGAATFMYIGLALIALGSGGIKPCVSANVGDQFDSTNGHLVRKIFQIFYFIINFGSFFSTLATPYLYDRFGAEVAFGVPGVFMALATLMFFLGRNRFVRVPPNPGPPLGALDTAAAVLFFSPVMALIAAVFIEGDRFKAPSAEGKSAGQFYSEYLSKYVVHLGVSSWGYFAIAAALCVLGFLLFKRRSRAARDHGFLSVLLLAFEKRKERKPGQGFFDVVRAEVGEEAAEGPPAVLRIIVVFSMVSVFWALFDQHASTWVQQAKEMDRFIRLPLHTARWVAGAAIGGALYGATWISLTISNRTIPKVVSRVLAALLVVLGVASGVRDLVSGDMLELQLKAAQIQALNPLMVMIIIPTLNALVFNPRERKGKPLKPLARMTIGMFLAAAAFATAAILQGRVEAAAAAGAKVHVLYQVAQYLVMTTSEVLISVTGLEFAYTQAPRRMKSTIMGFWLLCVTFGNVLVAFLSPMQKILTLSQFFWVFTGLMAVASVVFTVLARRYKGKSYLQEARH